MVRFATPFNSLIDSDGVPHLPKLGKALGKYFIGASGHIQMHLSSS